MMNLLLCETLKYLILHPLAVHDWGPCDIINGSSGDLNGLILIAQNKLNPIDNWELKVSNGITPQMVDKLLFDYSYMMTTEIAVFRYISYPGESESTKKELNSRAPGAADMLRTSFDKFHKSTFQAKESYRTFIYRYWCRCLETLVDCRSDGFESVKVLCANI